MTYAIADIHGEYDKLLRLLEEVHFSEGDTLYVIGDVLDRRQFVMDALPDLPFYEEVTMEEGAAFVLVHAGLPDFEADKALSDYDPLRMLWDRPDYEAAYYPDKTIIVGHTPTALIEGNDRAGSIFHGQGIIDIDCGACFKNGRLAALCLETMEEYYVS